MAGLKLITPPILQPIALADVKNYLRITGTTDDAMLTGMIDAATAYIERITSRRLITQTWDYYLDSFPAQKFNDAAFGGGDYVEGKLSEFLGTAGFLTIPLFPLQSVTYLNTYADDAVAVLMASSDYIVDTVSEPGRLSVKTSTTWPTTFLRPVNGVQVRFICGYGANPTDVPYGLRQAIQNIVGVFYLQRGCDESKIPPSISAQIQTYRIMRLA
jgi:hypothetical protein